MDQACKQLKNVLLFNISYLRIFCVMNTYVHVAWFSVVDSICVVVSIVDDNRSAVVVLWVAIVVVVLVGNVVDWTVGIAVIILVDIIVDWTVGVTVVWRVEIFVDWTVENAVVWRVDIFVVVGVFVVNVGAMVDAWVLVDKIFDVVDLDVRGFAGEVDGFKVVVVTVDLLQLSLQTSISQQFEQVDEAEFDGEEQLYERKWNAQMWTPKGKHIFC